MGYDHFALIALQEDVEELIDKVIEVIKSIKTDEILFGEVHHLSSGGFDEYWWKRFDDFIYQIYKKTGVELYLYVCEFDGETLTKYKYVKGMRKDKGKDITTRINDEDITLTWNIKSLIINLNITSLYNEDYVWDVYE